MSQRPGAILLAETIPGSIRSTPVASRSTSIEEVAQSSSESLPFSSAFAHTNGRFVLVLASPAGTNRLVLPITSLGHTLAADRHPFPHEASLRATLLPLGATPAHDNNQPVEVSGRQLRNPSYLKLASPMTIDAQNLFAPREGPASISATGLSSVIAACVRLWFPSMQGTSAQGTDVQQAPSAGSSFGPEEPAEPSASASGGASSRPGRGLWSSVVSRSSKGKGTQRPLPQEFVPLEGDPRYWTDDEINAYAMAALAADV
ncbi:hypothetical protein HDU87_000714 [Geranomyces variabilis]|uniref:Uncharacterized protein n=1 Tax=Geranomyces variabilis TaxID=109894 RepID=A0AAD5TNV5_9FUNG|nr:hypothetical protein HDU87_000714 [Geranomyces variabilis]